MAGVQVLASLVFLPLVEGTEEGALADRDSLRCLLCGGNRHHFLVTGYDRIRATAEDYRYVRCDGCGLVFPDPLPQPGEIPGYYPDDYIPHSAPLTWDRNKTGRRLAIRYFYGAGSTSRSRLLRSIFRMLSGRIMRDLCEPHGENRMLDVGCGSGGLMDKHRALGWSVCGVEVSSRACASCRARGLEVYEGTLLDAPLQAHRFDVILLNHVVEHLLDPVAALRRAAGLLAAGGKVIVRTPNIAGLGFGLYRSCWTPLEIPRHIFLFDPFTIRLLAQRSGLAVRSVSTRPEANMLRESRHCARSQGQSLPAGLEARKELLAKARQSASDHRMYRRLISPVALLFSFAGRGDTLVAEFGRETGH